MPINQEMLKTAQKVSLEAAKSGSTKQAISLDDVVNAGGAGLITGGAGAGLGGLAGAAMGGKGNRLRGALRGAATGGLIGGGAGIGGYLLSQPSGGEVSNAVLTQEYLKDRLDRALPDGGGPAGYSPYISDLKHDLIYRHGPVNAMHDRVDERANTGLLGGGIVGALLAKGLVPKKNQPKKKPEAEKEDEKSAQSARVFGAKYAAGLDLSGLQKYLPGAGVGAGAGALVGGLGGLMFPGKRRGRLSGALRGALAGAGVGGLAGGAAGGGVFGQGAQNAMADVYKRLGELYIDKFNPKSRLAMRPQTPEEFATAAGEEYTGGPTPVSETDNTVALNKAEHRRATLAKHPSAGGDYAMAQALSRPPQTPPTPAAPMSQDLLDAYGAEPTGQ